MDPGHGAAGCVLAKMNWDKARRDERARRAERDTPPKKSKSTAFRLRYPSQCTKCGDAMPAGTPARFTADDAIVHASGCSTEVDPVRKKKRRRKSPQRGPGARTKPGKKRSRKLKVATPCTTCGVTMEAGDQATTNKGGRLVHPNGCPKKTPKGDGGPSGAA